MTHALTLHTSDDLEAAWRFVDGGFGYSAPQLFVLLVEPDGSVVPNIIQVYDDDLGDDERDEMVANLFGAIRTAHLADQPGSAVAVMRARPGHGPLTRHDAEWCRIVHRQLAKAGLDAFTMYFATDESLGPVPADVLIEAA